MARAPKNFKVLLSDGTEARAVRLTPRNNKTMLAWIPGAEYRASVSASGQENNQRLMIPKDGSKVLRAAYYDDWVVKTDRGFHVVKFDKVGESLFFVDRTASGPATRRTFKRWQEGLV